MTTLWVAGIAFLCGVIFTVLVGAIVKVWSWLGIMDEDLYT